MEFNKDGFRVAAWDDKMKVIISAGGRFHALHLAHQLEKQGHLQCLYSAAYQKTDQHYVNKKHVRLFRIGKYADLIFEKFRLSKLIPLSWWYSWKDGLFDRWVARDLKKRASSDLFIGWAHYFLESLPQIKKTGATLVLESGSMHILEQQKILQEEYKKFNIQAPPIHQKNISKMLAEYQAADYIMVPANHVAQSFIKQGIVAEKLRIVPYGVNLERFYPAIQKPSFFRILFVGQVGLRKGVYYLLEAFKKLQLPYAELIIIGNMQPDFTLIYKQFALEKNIKFLGAMSSQELAAWYRQASIFVLPSLEEGVAMVQAEALASGLPLICTTNSGGALFIENNDCGFVLSVRDEVALAEKIKFLYDNPEVVEQMGKKAVQKAQQFSWDAYGKRVIEVYKELMERKV